MLLSSWRDQRVLVSFCYYAGSIQLKWTVVLLLSIFNSMGGTPVTDERLTIRQPGITNNVPWLRVPMNLMKSKYIRKFADRITLKEKLSSSSLLRRYKTRTNNLRFPPGWLTRDISWLKHPVFNGMDLCTCSVTDEGTQRGTTVGVQTCFVFHFQWHYDTLLWRRAFVTWWLQQCSGLFWILVKKQNKTAKHNRNCSV